MLLLKSSWSTNALLAICLWCISASLFSCFESKSSLLSLVKKSNRNKLHNSASGLTNLSLNGSNRQKMGGRRRMHMLGAQSPNPMYNPYQQAYAPQQYAPPQYAPQAYQPYQYLPPYTAPYSAMQAPQPGMPGLNPYAQMAGQGESNGSLMPLAARQQLKPQQSLFNIRPRGGVRLNRPKTDADLTQADILKAANTGDEKTEKNAKVAATGQENSSMTTRRMRNRGKLFRNRNKPESAGASSVDASAPSVNNKEKTSAAATSVTVGQQKVRARIAQSESDINGIQAESKKPLTTLVKTGSGLNAQVSGFNFRQRKINPVRSDLRKKVTDVTASQQLDSSAQSKATVNENSLGKSGTAAATAIEKAGQSKSVVVATVAEKTAVPLQAEKSAPALTAPALTAPALTAPALAAPALTAGSSSSIHPEVKISEKSGADVKLESAKTDG